MPIVYDNWGRLFAAVQRRQQYLEMAHAHSRSTSAASSVSFDFDELFLSWQNEEMPPEEQGLNGSVSQSRNSLISSDANRSEVEWIEQYEIGVDVTVVEFADGSRHIKQVRFSMDEIEIPQYFLCPISLQIMQDPVTTVTGITYDRESIEQRLSAAAPSTTCLVTKQPLHRDSELTPNHVLHRLIQAWCIANDNSGIDRIPKSPTNKSNVVKLFRGLENPVLCVNSLKKMDERLASGNENNRKCMVESGVANAMVRFVLRCSREGNTIGLEEALRILPLTIWNSTPSNKQLFKENSEFFQAITWILKTTSETNQTLINQAVLVLKMVTEIANTSLLERLRLDFFQELVNVLQKTTAVKPVLQTLIQICPLGSNRIKIVETGAVFELIEMELSGQWPEKKSTTELIFNLLAQLCSCADGRAQLIKHPGGIALVSKRLLRVSAATDEISLYILSLISRFSATPEVLMEMLNVGAVSKICMVTQADCAEFLRKKSREIWRLHSNVWSNSPCIRVDGCSVQLAGAAAVAGILS